MATTVRSMAPEHPVIEAVFSGNLSREDVRDAFTQCVVMGMEQEIWSVLADCSQVVRTPTFTDLKDLVDALSDLGVQDVFREAVVRPIDVMAATSIAYWETAGVNRGLAIRTFRTREDALAWLDE